MITLVQELYAIAEEVEKNRNLTRAIEKVKQGWEGETADNFLEKCERLRNLINNEATNIRNLAANLNEEIKGGN